MSPGLSAAYAQSPIDQLQSPCLIDWYHQFARARLALLAPDATVLLARLRQYHSQALICRCHSRLSRASSRQAEIQHQYVSNYFHAHRAQRVYGLFAQCGVFLVQLFSQRRLNTAPLYLQDFLRPQLAYLLLQLRRRARPHPDQYLPDNLLAQLYPHHAQQQAPNCLNHADVSMSRLTDRYHAGATRSTAHQAHRGLLAGQNRSVLPNESAALRRR